MKLEDFHSKLVSENKKLRLITLISFIVFCLLVSKALNKDRYIIVNETFNYTERLKKEVCIASFISVTSNKLDLQYINDQVVKLLKNDPYIVTYKRILLSEVTDNVCKIIVKSDKLRSFVITLDNSNEYPFKYKLIAMEEVLPKDLL